MRDFHLPGRSPIYADNGMCATSHPLAAQTAIDILKKGGNAMDAAIAGAVLLGFCEPAMTGLGGDCFVLFSQGQKTPIHGLNGSGHSPSGISAQSLRERGLNTVPIHGIEAITIPGAVDAFCKLSDEWGRLGLEAILAPAIDYAKAGIPIAPRVAYDYQKNAQVLNETAKRHFLINGHIPKVGERINFVAQAKALQKIAQFGRDGFYKGEVADDMLATLISQGGTHTEDDFNTQNSFYTQPIHGKYGPINLVEHPPNGQGATAILMLNILSHFELDTLDPTGAKRAHIEAEATKLAYAARNRIIADPNYTDVINYMLSRDTAQQFAEQINEKIAGPVDPTLNINDAIHKDTVYITVVDQNRFCVSLIYSIFHGFGSGIASEKFGILFQNRGAGFSLVKGHPNELGPRKRPMHTIIPAMLTQSDKVLMPFGVMGGSYQPCGHARVVSNIIDYGMHPQAAIDCPRSFFDMGNLSLEHGYKPSVIQELIALGHKVNLDIDPIGGGQAIYIHENGVLEGGSDPRKDGCAIGY